MKELKANYLTDHERHRGGFVFLSIKSDDKISLYPTQMSSTFVKIKINNHQKLDTDPKILSRSRVGRYLLLQHIT